MNDMNYYTYAYLREDKTPYYIGKGTENRIYSTNRRVKPPKDKSRIIFLKQNLTEEEAFKHEVYMIAVFGRKDNGTGILRNRTDGGEGSSNRGTPEKRSEIVRKGRASMTPEQRSEATRKAREIISNMTPEQRSEASRKGHANMTPEQRSERTRKGRASMTPEQRSESARKAKANMTPEQRSEASRKGNASRTPEQRSEIARKSQASRTPEQRREIMRKASSQMFQCTVTGFITNAGSLSAYQKAKGIDTSKRVRLNQ
jgi:general stress protein YciG